MNDPPTALVGFGNVEGPPGSRRLSMNDPPTALVGLGGKMEGPPGGGWDLGLFTHVNHNPPEDLPVLPKPPAPRDVTSSSLTSTVVASTTC